jgi:hypothetical protein
MTHLSRIIKRYPDEALDLILNNWFWPVSLDTKTFYKRRSDDTDGLDSNIGVAFSQDGDAWVEVISNFDPDESNFGSHRFRMPMQGGGRSGRVRNALLFLARAIMLDEKELPDPPVDRGKNETR